MRRKVADADDFDLDLDLSIDDDGEESSPLDELFDDYHTPDVPDDEDAEAPFIETVASESAGVLAEFEHADKSSRMRNAKDAVNSGVDYNYFVSIVFVSEAQKEQFIQAMNWEKYGGSRFLNGVQMANDLGVTLDDAYMAVSAGADAKLTAYENRRKQNGGSK